MTEEEAIAREEVEKSTQAIRWIDDLTSTAGFQAYAAKIERKAEEMAEAVLHGVLPAQDREDIRLKRIGMLSGLRMLETDREGHANILRGHGIEV